MEISIRLTFQTTFDEVVNLPNTKCMNRAIMYDIQDSYKAMVNKQSPSMTEAHLTLISHHAKAGMRGKNKAGHNKPFVGLIENQFLKNALDVHDDSLSCLDNQTKMRLKEFKSTKGFGQFKVKVDNGTLNDSDYALIMQVHMKLANGPGPAAIFKGPPLDLVCIANVLLNIPILDLYSMTWNDIKNFMEQWDEDRQLPYRKMKE